MYELEIAAIISDAYILRRVSLIRVHYGLVTQTVTIARILV